jgi:hypothetical protein
MAQTKNRKAGSMKYDLGTITTGTGLKIKYPKAFPLIDIKDIVRNPKNIKLHNKDQIHDIAELIKMIGFKDPVVLDSNKMMFAGHGRIDAAELLQMPKVPWYPISKLTEEQKKVFLIMDNKVNESPWVSENLKIIFDEVAPINFDNFKMNFDDYFIKNIDLSEQEWTNMPEYEQEDLDAYRRIFVKFDNEDDIKEFAKVTKQNISRLTKSMWFPYKPYMKTEQNWKESTVKD